MLVLSRKSNQSIVIDSDITVTVLETHGKRVRIGIEAPNDVKIIRAELEQSPRPIRSAISSPVIDEPSRDTNRTISTTV